MKRPIVISRWRLLFIPWVILTPVILTENISKLPEPQFSRIKNCPYTHEEDCNDLPSNLGSRLPEDVIPSRYVITISPDFSKNSYHGDVQIDFNILKPMTYVALHAKDLTIESTKLYRSDSFRTNHEEVVVESVCPVKRYEMMLIRVGKEIAGEYSLTMNFSGVLGDGNKGFYLSTYPKDECEKIGKLATTQFEPIYARRAFPCFDEPSFKAVFHARIVYSSSSGYRALSNMPIIKLERPVSGSDLMIATFAPTLPMPTYLLAFIVSDFECSTLRVNSLNGRSIPVSIYARPSFKKEARFVLDVATRAMEYYMSLFDMDYPLPKIDLVAIPDFAAGAMENWGLVTFRETEVFYSIDYSSCGNVKSVSLTVAHELAHMWFGNLVTMKWWDDLWLNEGFASYMELIAVDFIFPEWKQKENFALETKYAAMKSDSKMSTRAIVHFVEHSDEIGEMFDHISYLKGAAVIRMLENAMGRYRFIRSIRRYLQKYRYSNVTNDQLFEILRCHWHCDIDVVDFMNRWTKLPGFPVVNLRGDGTVFELFQERFLASKVLRNHIESTWSIPIKYITSRKEDGVHFAWFLANASCARLTLERSVDWIKLNHDSVGYYIVNYTEDTWRMFGNSLFDDIEILNPVDRADLLHDAFLLADAGELCYHVVLNLTNYLLKETAFQPWDVTANWLIGVDKLLRETSIYRQFQHYAQNLINPIYKTVGWDVGENDAFVDRELRMIILKLACTVGHEDCLKRAKESLIKFADGNGVERLHPDLRSVIYSFGFVTLGRMTESVFNKTWNLFAREKNVQEKDRLLMGMTNVRDSRTLCRYLERIQNESFVRRQDFFQAVIWIASNPRGLDVVWNFFRNNWGRLVEKYTLNDSAMSRALGFIVSSFKDLEKLKEVEDFFRNHPEAGVGENARKDALEELENNIHWLKTNVEWIKRWLNTNGFGNFINSYLLSL